MPRSALIVVCLLIAAVLVGANPPAFAEEPESAPASAETAAAASCDAPVSLEDLSEADLAAWAEGAGLELIAPSVAAASSPPLCPDRRSCDPCELGEGPCFLKEFGSNSCCVSPTGPCILCPEGTTIIITTCPCVGRADCPRRDQDWQCG